MKIVVVESAADVPRAIRLALEHDPCLLIHQVWFDLGSGPDPESVRKFATARNSLRKHLGDEWLVLQWGEGASAEIARGFGSPVYESMYASYPLAIQRVDCVRYFLLCDLGGWYVDMDFHAAGSWTPQARLFSRSPRVRLVESQHCVLGMGAVSNSLIFAPRSSATASFFQGVLLPLMLRNRERAMFQTRHAYVMSSTGPAIVSEAYHAGVIAGFSTKLPKSIWNPCSACVTDSECGEIVDSSGEIMAFHGNAGSWESADSAIIMRGYCSSRNIILAVEMASIAGIALGLGVAMATT